MSGRVKIADAIEAADWRGVSIGNKAILRAAVDALRPATPSPAAEADLEAIQGRAQAFVDRKYVARADDRQREMGLAYVEAERRDLAKEISRFCASELSAAEAEVARLRAREAELVAALEPFARVVDAYDYYVPEVMPTVRFPIPGTRDPDGGAYARALDEDDFRRARALINGGSDG